MPRWLIEAFSTRRAEILKPLDEFGYDSARAAQRPPTRPRRAKTRPALDAVLPAPGSEDYDVDPRALHEQRRELSRHQESVHLYLTAGERVPDWVEHPAALADDPRTPYDKLADAVSVARAQTLALDQTTRRPRPSRPAPAGRGCGPCWTRQ